MTELPNPSQNLARLRARFDNRNLPFTRAHVESLFNEAERLQQRLNQSAHQVDGYRQRVTRWEGLGKFAGQAWAIITLLGSTVNAAIWVVTGDIVSLAISLVAAAVALWLHGEVRRAT